MTSRHGLVEVILELDVPVGDDTKQLGAQLSGFCDELAKVSHVY